LLAAVLASGIAAADPAPTSSNAEFSADIVSRDPAGSPIGAGGRLYAANGKVRIETAAASAGFFLIDGATATALYVRPQQRVFMDARQSTRLTRIFLPVDASTPCVQWQAAAKSAGVASAPSEWRCERVDSASRDGVIEYTITTPDRETTQGWIATKLAFPVKWRASDNTTFTLEHVRVGPQPADLFAVPSDYRKLDPQALIERIKHSDVWAAPPQ
jgi:hypothetical protein